MAKDRSGNRPRRAGSGPSGGRPANNRGRNRPMSPTSATGGGSPRGGTSHSNGSGGANSLLIAVSVGLVAVPVAGILAAAGYVAHGHGWL